MVVRPKATASEAVQAPPEPVPAAPPLLQGVPESAYVDLSTIAGARVLVVNPLAALVDQTFAVINWSGSPSGGVLTARLIEDGKLSGTDTVVTLSKRTAGRIDKAVRDPRVQDKILRVKVIKTAKGRYTFA